jgi:hypothetical protein
MTDQLGFLIALHEIQGCTRRTRSGCRKCTGTSPNISFTNPFKLKSIEHINENDERLLLMVMNRSQPPGTTKKKAP